MLTLCSWLMFDLVMWSTFCVNVQIASFSWVGYRDIRKISVMCTPRLVEVMLEFNMILSRINQILQQSHLLSHLICPNILLLCSIICSSLTEELLCSNNVPRPTIAIPTPRQYSRKGWSKASLVLDFYKLYYAWLWVSMWMRSSQLYCTCIFVINWQAMKIN